MGTSVAVAGTGTQLSVPVQPPVPVGENPRTHAGLFPGAAIVARLAELTTPESSPAGDEARASRQLLPVAPYGLPPPDSATTRDDISVPDDVSQDNRRRMAYKLGVLAIRQLGLNEADYAPSDLLAMGEQMAVDHIVAPDAQGVRLWIALARMEGGIAAGPAGAPNTEQDAERLAERVIAFIRSEFKDEIALDRALSELAALEMPLREEMAGALLRQVGLDPGRRVDTMRLIDPDNPLAENEPRTAREYYFNHDVLSAATVASMSGHAMTPEQAQAIVARLPASLDAEFATRFDRYARKVADITTGWLESWIASVAAKHDIPLSGAEVTVSRARLAYYRLEGGMTRLLAGFRNYGRPMLELEAGGYIVSIRSARGTHRYFLNTTQGVATSLPADGSLEVSVKTHRTTVFDASTVHAADNAGLTGSLVRVDTVASGPHAGMTEWLTSAFRADVERARESARGRTPAEAAIDSLLDTIPFRAMIVAIQKGEVERAAVLGYFDVLSLIPIVGWGGRVASSVVKAGIPLIRLALMRLPLMHAVAARAGWGGWQSFAARAAGLRTSIRSALTTTAARAWGRLRPLDAERIAAALGSRHPRLAADLERVSARLRGPIVSDGWWRVAPTPDQAPARSIVILSPIEAHSRHGGNLTLLPYGAMGRTYTRVDSASGQRVGALLIADEEGWLYQSLPAQALERYRVTEPTLLQALATRAAGSEGARQVGGRFYARIEGDYVEIVQDRAVSDVSRVVWRAVPPAGTLPDVVAYRLVHDARKNMWRNADIPVLRGGGASSSTARAAHPQPVDFQDVLVLCIRGKPTEAQVAAFKALLARVVAHPRGKAILRAMRAHYELCDEVPDIVFREGADVNHLPRPTPDGLIQGGRWNLDLAALGSESMEEVLREFGVVYGAMSGVLAGTNRYRRILVQGKPPVSHLLELAWKRWIDEGGRLVHPRERLRRQTLIDGRLRPMLREMVCYGGLSQNAMNALLRSVLRGEDSHIGAEIRVDLSFADVSQVPPLPNDVEKLSLLRSRITNWRNLPGKLKSLDLRECNLRHIPVVLPAGLESLDVSRNYLLRLPALLPSGLRALRLSGNMLTQLPTTLPPGLEYLDVSRNRLSDLPALPRGLRALHVRGNNLAALPSGLSPGLEVIDASYNRLRHLPEDLPTLRVLDLRQNRLTRLPESIRRLAGCDIYLTHNPIALENIPLFPADQPGPRIEFSFDDTDFEPSPTLAKAVERWLEEGDRDAMTRWKSIAGQMSDAREVTAFRGFLDRLHGTVGYNNDVMREEVREWLVELAKPEREALRRATLLVCADGTETCVDRMAWTMNQARTLRLNDDIQRGHYDERLDAVLEAARQMFRLESLNEIARRKVATMSGNDTVDELEVFLAYAVKLKDRLGLATVAGNMRYFSSSRVREQDLDDALAEVTVREQAEFDQYLAIDYEPWRTLLQRKLGDRYDAAVERTHELVAERLEGDIDAEIAALGLEAGDQEARKDLGIRLTRELQYSVLGPLTRDYLKSLGLPATAEENPAVTPIDPQPLPPG